MMCSFSVLLFTTDTHRGFRRLSTVHSSPELEPAICMGGLAQAQAMDVLLRSDDCKQRRKKPLLLLNEADEEVHIIKNLEIHTSFMLLYVPLFLP